MIIYTIPSKSSNSGSIHDIASDRCDRDIVFGSGCTYAVVLASYYDGRGYTTHKTESATVAASKRNSKYSHKIIDDNGNEYAVYMDRLVPLHRTAR